MIAITGASGHLGQLVIQELLKMGPASQIVALVRNPTKAQNLRQLGVDVRTADYNNPQSLESALKGIKKLLLISSSEIGQRERQHLAVLSAAQTAGVPFVAYTSILKADTSILGLATEHLATEKTIKSSGLAFTLLRNGWYLENHSENLASALQHGVIFGAAKSGRFSSASRADYAAAAAVVLMSDAHNGKTYELAGDQSFTLQDLATEVSRLSGKAVTYQDLSFADYKKALLGFGLPEGFAHLLADSDVGAAAGHLESHSRDLTQLIGRPTTTLNTALTKALKKG